MAGSDGTKGKGGKGKRGKSRRRAQGEGTIRQRVDGRWEARVTLPDGSTKSYYAPTQAEARQKLTAALRDLDRGVPLRRDERQTLQQYLAIWLEMVKPALKPKVYRNYEQIMRLHVTPTLGRLTLVKLTPLHVQRLYAQRLEAGLSPTTVHHIHAALHKALGDAVRLGLLLRNVTEAVSAPRMAEHELRVLSLAEAAQLLDAARGHRLEALFVLALTTGMRQGELLALRWRDVDLTRGTLHVRATLHKHRGEVVFATPKTKASRRQIRLARHAAQALSDHRARQRIERIALADVWDDQDLVFCDAVGGPLDPTHVLRRAFYPLLRAAGLRPMRFHDLRHTAATLLLADYKPTKMVSDLLGHSSTVITDTIYAHVTPDIQADIASAMDRLLWGDDEGDAKAGGDTRRK